MASRIVTMTPITLFIILAEISSLTTTNSNLELLDLFHFNFVAAISSVSASGTVGPTPPLSASIQVDARCGLGLNYWSPPTSGLMPVDSQISVIAGASIWTDVPTNQHWNMSGNGIDHIQLTASNLITNTQYHKHSR